MSIEAMKQALAKFEHLWEIGIDAEYKVELLPEIEALRQAIEQAEKQEPVAYKYTDKTNPLVFYFTTHKDSLPNPDVIETALYTAPQKYCPSENNTAYEKGFVEGMAKQTHSSVDRAVNAMTKPWVGLTDEEIVACGWCDLRFARAIETKLKEKNNG